MGNEERNIEIETMIESQNVLSLKDFESHLCVMMSFIDLKMAQFMDKEFTIKEIIRLPYYRGNRSDTFRWFLGAIISHLKELQLSHQQSCLGHFSMRL